MAVANHSRAPRTPASPHPREGSRPNTGPGYGKRTVPERRPPRADDFALLPERERHIAGYVDALPEGGAMDIKSLARTLPLYGQMAVGSALKALSVAGHLRRVRCGSTDGNGAVRWTTRTYWSRTAHDNEWWTTFLTTEQHRPVPDEPTPAPVPAPAPVPVPVSVPASVPVPALVPQQRTAEPQPEPRPGADGDRRPSRAFMALARLGRTDARLALSAADCAELEQLAAEWFERGVGAEYLTGVLTAGLPDAIGSPFGFVRRRLRDKLPPRLPAPTPRTASEAPVRRMLVECTECRTPGRPEAFHDGLCRPCRQPEPDTDPAP
ncbi:MarR family transcriptional regulator [Streptomyces sp. NPDC056053]|uniref:MarR family transcriptional regulator n=1 Tax=Streptomyces sp. NPDC056053 TaxID=3345696 RepID=UPI0035E271B7